MNTERQAGKPASNTSFIWSRWIVRCIFSPKVWVVRYVQPAKSMGVADTAALVASEVGGLKITPHPARKKRDRPMTSGVHTVVTGPLLEGGQAGVASVLSVHTRDANGQRRTTGGDVITVTLLPQDGAKVDAHVTDNTDGTYSCVVLPQKASPHCTLTVMVNGLLVEGSPFKTQILPGGIDASCTEVYGRGLYDGMAGQRCDFTIALAPALARTPALAVAMAPNLPLAPLPPSPSPSPPNSPPNSSSPSHGPSVRPSPSA